MVEPGGEGVGEALPGHCRDQGADVGGSTDVILQTADTVGRQRLDDATCPERRSLPVTSGRYVHTGVLAPRDRAERTERPPTTLPCQLRRTENRRVVGPVDHG